MINKLCIKCNLIQNELDYSPSQFIKCGGWCRTCNKEYRKFHYEKNKNSYKDYSSIYYKNNKSTIDLANASYLEANKNKIDLYQKQYRLLHKEEKALYNKQYVVDRINKDHLFKIRKRISNSIFTAIKRNGSIKIGSILKNLPYSILDLKEHLENQFEPWMNWNNHGKYIQKYWMDNDPLTWKWNIDHIVPHSYFKYSSMQDQSFRDCWTLSNLRPFSAKQNIIDSDRKLKMENKK